LLDNDAVHGYFETVKAVAEPDKEMESSAFLLTVHVLKPLGDVVIDRP
jgi:hypothetical protein